MTNCYILGEKIPIDQWCNGTWVDKFRPSCYILGKKVPIRMWNDGSWKTLFTEQD